MRLLAACTGVLLLSACGDDSAMPDAPAIDGPRIDAPAPDAPAAQRGVVVVRHLGVVDAGVADDGGFFDFNGDNVPDNALADLSQLNNMVQNGICPDPGPCAANGLRLLGRLDSYDSPTDDPSLSVALLHAFDGDSDPNDDFNGLGAFLIDPASLDTQGNPASVLTNAHITNGTLYAQSSGDIALQLGPVTFHLKQGRIRARVIQNGEGTSLQSGILGGILPACTAKQIQISALQTTLLDLITNAGCTQLPDGGASMCGSQIQPDIEINGNTGLMRFDNDFGTVTACHEGTLTVTGANCACDTRFAGGDGYSAVLFFDALPARIVGTAPQMDAGAP